MNNTVFFFQVRQCLYCLKKRNGIDKIFFTFPVIAKIIQILFQILKQKIEVKEKGI